MAAKKKRLGLFPSCFERYFISILISSLSLSPLLKLLLLYRPWHIEFFHLRNSWRRERWIEFVLIILVNELFTFNWSLYFFFLIAFYPLRDSHSRIEKERKIKFILWVITRWNARIIYLFVANCKWFFAIIIIFNNKLFKKTFVDIYNNFTRWKE